MAVSLPPLLVAAWLAVPALKPQPRTISGELHEVQACWVMCARVISVASTRLSCKADFLGTPYACPSAVLQPGNVTVAYIGVPSLAGLLRIAPTAGVVTRVERDGRVVFASSPSRQVWRALYGGWLFHAIYWPIAGFVVWRWPHSRFSRKIHWQQGRGS